MAGDNIFKDPAIERWADMRENTVQYFRWNRRNIRIALLFGVVVPIGVYTLAKYTTRRFNLVGRRRGESLLAKPESA